MTVSVSNQSPRIATYDEICAIGVACRGRDLAALTKFLDKYGATSIDLRNEFGMALLGTAAMFGDTEGVKLLLKRGASVNLADKDGHTPLMRAVPQKDLELVHVLLEGGADVNLCSAEENAPLMIAARGGSVEIITALLEKGAHIKPASNNGWTAVTWAERMRHTEAADLLRGWDAECERRRQVEEAQKKERRENIALQTEERIRVLKQQKKQPVFKHTMPKG